MEVYGVVFPFEEATEDGRLVIEVEIDLTRGPIPLYYEQRAVGSIDRVFCSEEDVNVEGTILDADLINSWKDGVLSFQGELDKVEVENGYDTSGRLRRVVLGTDPAFDGTRVYRK